MAVNGWITVVEAVEIATAAGKPITRATIGRWCQSGKVPASMVGRSWAIYEAGFRRFLDEYEPYPEFGRSRLFRYSPIAGISPTAYAVYRYVLKFKAENDGVSPTLVEISAGIGLASFTDISRRLRELETAGLVRTIGKHSGKRILITGGKWLPPQNIGETAPNK